MRILIISDHSDPLAEIGSKEAGGQNVYVYYLARNLARLGVFVDVYTRWDKPNKREIAHVNHHMRVIRVKAGPKRYLPKEEFSKVLAKFGDEILRRIERERIDYDLIHSNYWYSGLVGIRLSQALKIPHFFVFHSIGKIRFETFKRFDQAANASLFEARLKAESEITRNVDRIISTSPVEKEIVQEIFGMPSDKIVVIPIGVDTNIFRPQLRSTHRVSNIIGKRILYVGRLEWRKGLGTLIRAFALIKKDFPGSTLSIVGGGKSSAARKLESAELAKQAALIQDLRLEDSVLYEGPVPQKQLRYYYSAADLCVVPSYYEPFGIVPLESMACGTPVVASRTGGLQYTVLDGITGRLAEPRNYLDLADKMREVLTRGKAMHSPSCLFRIRRHFTWEKISREYLNYFEEFINRKEDI